MVSHLKIFLLYLVCEHSILYEGLHCCRSCGARSIHDRGPGSGPQATHGSRRNAQCRSVDEARSRYKKDCVSGRTGRKRRRCARVCKMVKAVGMRSCYSPFSFAGKVEACHSSSIERVGEFWCFLKGHILSERPVFNNFIIVILP